MRSPVDWTATARRSTASSGATGGTTPGAAGRGLLARHGAAADRLSTSVFLQAPAPSAAPRRGHRAAQGRLVAEQIAGRLKVEPESRPQHRLCHQTIYRFVYSKDGQSQDLARHLPERRRTGKLRPDRKPRALCFQKPRASIAAPRRSRPSGVRPLGGGPDDISQEPGPANVATVVERKSRFTVLFRNNDRTSKPLMGRLIEVLGPYSQSARAAATARRGARGGSPSSAPGRWRGRRA